MLERLLPNIAAFAETREDELDIELFESERLALGCAVQKRRREFVTGRACARLALRRLGAPVVAIPSGARGEPRWPPGIVGSITHCHGYRACAVAWSEALAGIGIDAEPNAPLPAGVLEAVAHGGEREQLAAGMSQTDLGRLAFSAKEAVFKAWFPLARRWLDFTDVTLSLDVPNAEFRAAVLVPAPAIAGVTLTELRGRWCVEDGVICTAVIVPVEGGGGAVASP
jgi:4'-phosphopantetheinyl transferase EntD